MQFRLKHGMPFGKGDDKELQFDVELRSLTAGDLIEAEAASERVVMTSQGPKLLSSPSRMGFEVIRRSIARIGKIQGPLDMDMLKSLEEEDLNLIMDMTEAHRTAGISTAEQVADTGR